MSNVFRRFHKETGNEFFDTAMQIEVSVTRFLMNDKNIPKRYFYVYTVPILNKVSEMQNHITEAMTKFPATEALLEEKKRAFMDAICACEQVIRGLQRACLVLPIDVNKLDNIGALLTKESELLRKARSNSRVQQDKRNAKTQ